MNNLIENWLIKLCFMIGRYSKKNKVTILNFHRVMTKRDIFYSEALDLDTFRQKMQLLVKYFNVVSLSQAIKLMDIGELPPYSVVVTIDDGYKDCYTTITPVLEELGIKGTFFIATEGLELGGLWKDRVVETIREAKKPVINNMLGFRHIAINTIDEKKVAIALICKKLKYLTIAERESQLDELCTELGFFELTDLFLTKENIQAMHIAGMEIGAHTHKHPILQVETIECAYREIQMSKEILEGIIASKVKHFAFPNGKYGLDYDHRHMQLLESLEFNSGLSTNWGTLTNIAEQRFNIPRFTPWDNSDLLFSLRLMNNFRNKVAR